MSDEIERIAASMHKKLDKLPARADVAIASLMLVGVVVIGVLVMLRWE